MADYPYINPQAANATIMMFVNQANEQRRKQTEAQLLQRLMGAKEPESQRQIMSEALQGPKQNLFQRLLQIPTKQQMLMDSPSAMSVIGSLMGTEKQQKEYGVAPWHIDPKYKDTPEAQAERDRIIKRSENTEKPPKPLSPSQLKAMGVDMDTLLDAAKQGDAGGYDYTADNLQAAWEEFESLADFDNLPENQQSQLQKLWDLKIQTRNAKTNKIGRFFTRKSKEKGEYDWPGFGDATAKSSAPNDISETSVRLQSAPTVKLNAYWPKLSATQKKQALAALDNGYSEDDIIAALGG